MSFRHTPDMGEISGFGGAYEDACQDMLEAGMKWLMGCQFSGEQPVLEAHGLKWAFGLFTADSPDAKGLEEAVLEAVPDCSGAMHHAVMSRLFWIAKHGWDAYCAEMRKRHADEASGA